MNVWMDASSLAVGVSVEINGSVIKDMCWVHPLKDMQHNNVVEFNTLLKGANLTLKWQVGEIHLKMNSLCIYHLVSSSLMCKA